jgi:hypothetical protein
MKTPMSSLLAALLLVGAGFAACGDSAATRAEETQEEPEKEKDEKKFYYGGNVKNYLDKVPGKIVLSFDEKHLPEIESYLKKFDQIVHTELDNPLIILTTTENSNTKTLIADLKKQTGVKSVHPVYKLADFISPEMCFTDEFIVQFKDHVSQQQMDEMHKKYRVEVIKRPEMYQSLYTMHEQLLSVPIDADLLDVANAYQESGLVEFSCPDFFSEVNVGP